MNAEERFHKELKECRDGMVVDGEFVRFYHGRNDLADVRPADFSGFLGRIKTKMNRDLAERKRVDHHIDDLPFHFDYIDSEFSNAVAFRDGSYAFIGITVKFVEDLLRISEDLSRSAAIRQILGFADGVQDELQVVFFHNLLNLTVTHEFTHHVHGHVIRKQGSSKFLTEFDRSDQKGSLQAQGDEVDADGYAVYHVLANALDSPLREDTKRALHLQNAPDSHIDEIIYLVFVIAVCAQFSSRGLLDVGDVDRGFIEILAESHPPQAARLDYLMRHAVLWCSANRPALAAWTTQTRFREIMSAVAEAMWGLESHRPWNNQAAFLCSEKGKEYMKQMSGLIDAQKAASGNGNGQAEFAAV